MAPAQRAYDSAQSYVLQHDATHDGEKAIQGARRSDLTR